MRLDAVSLPAAAPGLAAALTVRRFGAAGARPKAYIQAGLHADEIPGLLVAHHLTRRLTELEAAGRLIGEVALVPFANPVGLGQRLLGAPFGRFLLADGVNFNRRYPTLTQRAAELAAPRLGGDAAANVAVIRAALRQALDERPTRTAGEVWKARLLGLALDSDLALDLHCDAEAAVHVYTLTDLAPAFAPLAALLGAEAHLLADESGDEPFDEALSRPWRELALRFPDRPIPLACAAATIELRGHADVSHELADADAAALIAHLTLSGVVDGPRPEIPPARCRPTPLAASEPVTAPVDGVVVFRAAIGDRLVPGDLVAEIVDPATGAVTRACAGTAGTLYARVAHRFAHAGDRLAKIAGETPILSGNLLGP